MSPSKYSHHITGSASRSRSGKRHFYYHCNSCIKERFQAEKANEQIEMLLSAIKVGKEINGLFLVIKEREENGNPKQNEYTKEIYTS